ncbi:MAG: hypothetical protein ACRDQ0_06850, partial [Pseudonocardia sp.]
MRLAAVPVLGVALVLGAGGSAGAASANGPTQVWPMAGDTFNGIARELGVHPDALARANADRFPTEKSRDLIRADEPLNIPSDWDGHYEGGSWWEIHHKLRLPGDWKDLAEANPGLRRGADGSGLDAGAPVVVPGGAREPGHESPAPENPGHQRPDHHRDPRGDATTDPATDHPGGDRSGSGLWDSPVWDAVALWGGRALVAAAVVVAFVWLKRVLRKRAFAKRIAAWEAVEARSEKPAVLWDVLRGELTVTEAASRLGVSVAEVEETRDWAVALLTGGRLPILVEAAAGAAGQRVWTLNPLLEKLRARAPPAAVQALLRDPVATLKLGGKEEDYTRKAPEELAEGLAELVFGFLRGVVWDLLAVEGGPRPSTSLDTVTADLREASATLREANRGHVADVTLRSAIVSLIAARHAGSAWREAWATRRVPRELRDADTRRLRTELGDIRPRLRDHPANQKKLAAAEAIALREALNEGAIAGHGRKKVEKATRKASMRFVARNIANLLALFTAAAPESALMFTAKDEAIAGHYDLTTAKVNALAPGLTAASPLVGLGFSILGDRMITSMRWITLAVAVGLGGLVVAGLGGGSGVFGLIASTVALAVWDAVMGGPARARFDKNFPVVDEMAKAHRSAQLQSSFKLGQLLWRQAYLGAFIVIGVALSYLVMSVVALVGMVVILAYLKGGTLKVQPRAPPKLGAAARGVLDQIRGSRGGVRRWLSAIPVGTVLTGLPMYALGGGLVGIMLRLIIAANGESAWLIGTSLVGFGAMYLSLVPRVLAWGLGTPPIWAKLNTLLGGARGGGPVNQARVLLGLALLGAA